MSAAKINELQADVEELNKLLSNSSRQRSKDLLTLEIRKLQTELSRLKELTNGTNEIKPSTAPTLQRPKCYEVKLQNYAWDQSEKFVKIFVTLKNVHTLSAENVFSLFTENSMELHVNGLENRNYTLSLKNLLDAIDGTKSSWKIKTDMVVVSLAKVTTGKNWSHLTSSEKKAKEPKAMPKGDEEDPTAGLMTMMRQMYEDGDDDMKRTIEKAWTESRHKSGMPSI